MNDEKIWAGQVSELYAIPIPLTILLPNWDKGKATKGPAWKADKKSRARKKAKAQSKKSSIRNRKK